MTIQKLARSLFVQGDCLVSFQEVILSKDENMSYPFAGPVGRSGGSILPVPAFSAYSLLRNCNYFLESSTNQEAHLKALREVPSCENSKVTKLHEFPLFAIQDHEREFLPKHVFSRDTLLPYSHPLQLIQSDHIRSRLHLEPPGLSPNLSKKQRSEKRPIPEEQKDDKYFERRRRNNQAAKKSRDARKIREDQVALKATILEHENAILRAQVVTLREEASSLRQMLLHRKPFDAPAVDAQLCVLST